MSEIIVGVDIGGTTIKIGFVQMDGNMLDKWEIPTNTTNNGEFIVKEVWNFIHKKLIERNMDRNDVYGIGVGAPAFIDTKTGLVVEAVNIGWKNFDLTEQFSRKSNLPVYIENDANTAAYGEYWKGAGQGVKNLIVVTIGTGIGGGIITNGTILNGDNGMAGEIGHIKIDQSNLPCSCGGIGCLETVCSATGIRHQALKAVELYPSSKMANHYEKRGDLSVKDIMTFAKQGDGLAIDIVDHTTEILGRELANIATVTNPSKIIIGGGVSNSGDFLLDRIKLSFKRYAIPKIADHCEIKQAFLRNDAGILGSAYLVKQQFESYP